ncbi:pumilio homolog 12-like [Cicer arietinum]
MDCHGCRCLQAKIDEGNPRNVEAILSVVKDNIHELIKHPFANYLIQRIFKARNSVTYHQIHSLVLLLTSNHQKLIDVCKDNYGTRVMQNMLENINHPPTLYHILCTVECITLALMKNLNGSYVVLQCLKIFQPIYKKMLLDKVAQNCVEVATDKVGCTAIKKCLEHVGGMPIELLITGIVCNAMVLAVDPYGNYVLQYVIKMGVKKMVIEVLQDNFVRLSMDKHASNVVEDLLRYSEENDVAVIVEEIMTSRDFLTVVRDPFGNYVAQRALECTKGGLRVELSFLIKSYRKKLQNHIFGKRVLAEAMKILMEGNWLNF